MGSIVLTETLATSPHDECTFKRSRSSSALAVILLIVMGLASRKYFAAMPDILQKNLGDVLWAATVFFLLGFLFPRLSPLKLAAFAMAFSFCIELSKLFHAPWFDALRATGLGRLIFGYVFGWSNLVRYLIGIVLAALWDSRRTAKQWRHSHLSQ